MNNAAAIESLRSFALANLAALDNGMAFVHMCAQALTGDERALSEVEITINDIDYVLKQAWRTSLSVNVNNLKLDVIRNADTTRPDGAIARSFQV